MDLVNRSAIWYLQELDAVGNRANLTTTDALYLVYQDKLVRKKTREAIQASSQAWMEECRKQEATRHLFVASGRYMDWFRMIRHTATLRIGIFWLQWGSSFYQDAALRKIAKALLRIADLCEK